MKREEQAGDENEHPRHQRCLVKGEQDDQAAQGSRCRQEGPAQLGAKLGQAASRANVEQHQPGQNEANVSGARPKKLGVAGYRGDEEPDRAVQPDQVAVDQGGGQQDLAA